MLILVLISLSYSHSFLFKRGYNGKGLNDQTQGLDYYKQYLNMHKNDEDYQEELEMEEQVDDKYNSPYNTLRKRADNDQYGFSSINIHSEEYAYQEPTDGDSRSPCPFLNTLANHAILPRNGKDIEIQRLLEAVVHIGGLTPFIAKILANGGAKLGRKTDQGVPILSLSELALHSDAAHPAIEHDASLTRLDIIGPDGEKQDNASPNDELIDQLLFFQKNGGLTLKEVIEARKLRVDQSKSNKNHVPFTNKDWFVIHGETIFLVGILGGPNYKISTEFAESFLRNEKFPSNWQPRTKKFGIFEMLRRLTQVTVSTAFS